MDRIAMLREILAQNPADAFARYGLAMEYANQGQTETSLAEFSKLLQANPDYTAGYQMAAQTLMKSGRGGSPRHAAEWNCLCTTHAQPACARRNGSHAG
jgi:cytochrome c-type biogenesis protein CcmH/NrfG